MPESAIRHDPDHHRFILEADGTFGAVYYRLAPGAIAFTHTEVPREIGGRGIATRLARHALDYAREHGLKVDPMCPVVAAFMKRHPEYEDLRA